ncbi:MAG: Flp pilus assembly protein CpaB [Myxococcales bacterium]|nr:Flp pilus assembly protein CpaB [Myxococcales bacterium]
MNRTALLAAVVVAFLGILLFGLYTKRFEQEVRGGEPISILMATTDIPLGEPLTRSVLGTRDIPESYIEDRHIRESDIERILGVKVSTALRSNQSLHWTDLSTTSQERRELSSLLREGMRAITVQATRSSAFGGLLRPGDRVDVLLTAIRPGGTEEITVPLLQNILALAVGADTGGPDATDEQGRRQSRDVTLAVTMEQAAMLTHAEKRGELQLVLRNPNDVAIIEGLPETTASDLMEEQRRQRRQVRRQPPATKITKID